MPEHFSVCPKRNGNDRTGCRAGSWSTWLLDSGDQLRLDAAPDEAATADEIAELLALVNERDEAALQQIAYWNSGPPSYRWNQIAVGAVDKRGIPGTSGSRVMALVHVAVYDATIAAWDNKYTYNRPRPSAFNADLSTVIPNPSSPSYPSEYAVTAGAAATVLAWLFPERCRVLPGTGAGGGSIAPVGGCRVSQRR